MENKEELKNVIAVENVSMHFNMATEKVDSLRDYLTKALSRKLFFDDFVAVDNVSFNVKKGEVFGIVGTNGSGKSTLLKMIAGVLEPSKGKIYTHGTMAPLIELGAGFDGELTGRENIYLNGALLGYSKEFLDEKFKSIVDFAEMWKFLDMPLKNYSSGMTARIAFAIATAVKPDILIADEILAVGDFLFQHCIWRTDSKAYGHAEKRGRLSGTFRGADGDVQDFCPPCVAAYRFHQRDFKSHGAGPGSGRRSHRRRDPEDGGGWQ